MTEQTGFPSDPDQNRADWFAAHPGAVPVSGDVAGQQVASDLGAGAPAAGVSQQQLAAQMAAAGAAAGLPHEDVMNLEMERLKALVEGMGEQLATIQAQRQQEKAAALAAFGPPILVRYAHGIRDKLTAHLAANPGLGPDHFAKVIADAGTLAKAAEDAIARGANDLGQVHAAAGRVDRWLTRTHPRTAPALLKHIDLGSVEADLEELVSEAMRLAPDAGAMLALA